MLVPQWTTMMVPMLLGWAKKKKIGCRLLHQHMDMSEELLGIQRTKRMKRKSMRPLRQVCLLLMLGPCRCVDASPRHVHVLQLCGSSMMGPS